MTISFRGGSCIVCHPDSGYYASAAERLGQKGDYYTSATADYTSMLVLTAGYIALFNVTHRVGTSADLAAAKIIGPAIKLVLDYFYAINIKRLLCWRYAKSNQAFNIGN